jgi:solute:Na+ symporter, SSS family
LFTVDIYEKLRPGLSERHYVFIGRVATTVVVGLGILWIPVMARVAGGGLYQYLQSVQGYLAPPITAVFFLGLFWSRINATGAVWGLGGGFVLGMIKLTTQTFFGAEKISSPALLAWVGDFNFLYATGVLFAPAPCSSWRHP